MMNRRYLQKVVAALAVTAIFSPLLTAVGQRPAAMPNIILIMADDLGYESIGANGCDDYKTPVLDKLATTGVRFTNCFANPLCTPSRVKIMTRKYNVRNYVSFGVLDRTQKTFAHTFKSAGYATCIAGKWQLGNEQDSPQHFGFDQSCLWQHMRERTRAGELYDSRFNNPRLEINGELKDYDGGEYGPDVCAEFICDFIEHNKAKPFLAYYPMILTHCPFSPTPDTTDWNPQSLGPDTYKGDAQYFGDMVHHMDKMVGRILAKLEECELLENTIVIFTGDNGTDVPVVTSLNGRKIPGGKGQMNDNGTRVPLIVSYPGSIQAGAVSDELVDLADMFPTICDAAGLAIPGDRPIDGVSFWSTLQGRPGRKKPWIYIWYDTKVDETRVLARTKTHMVRRMNLGGPVEFLNCSTPYEEKPLQVDTLDGEEKATYETLLGVIRNLDKTSPEKLRTETEANNLLEATSKAAPQE
jgi:arylsulfatase A